MDDGVNCGRLPDKSSRVVGVTMVLLLASTVPACGEGNTSLAPPEEVGDAVRWEETLELEETADALIGIPQLRVDPRGGWLFWDGLIDEARVYARDGSLEQVVGSQGEGPGEYSRVRALLRLEDGRLVTVDASGRVGVWDSTGRTLLNHVESGLPRVVGALAMGGSRVFVYTAPRPVDSSGRLAPGAHLLDVDQEEVGVSGLSLAVDPSFITAVSQVEPPTPRKWGDSVYVALAVMDSMWALGSELRESGAAPLALSSDRIAANEPPVTVAEGPDAFRSWVDRSTFLGDVVRLPDGQWLGNTWSFHEGEFVGGLFLTDDDGRLLWELPSQLQVLEVDREGRVYFLDRDGMAPNQILVGRLR